MDVPFVIFTSEFEVGELTRVQVPESSSDILCQNLVMETHDATFRSIADILLSLFQCLIQPAKSSRQRAWRKGSLRPVSETCESKEFYLVR